MMVIEFIKQNALWFYIIGGVVLTITLPLIHRARQLQRKAPFGAERDHAGFLVGYMTIIAIMAVIILLAVTGVLILR